MKTKDRENKPICPKCAHKIEADGAPCPRCTAKPGGACPDCGRTLESGGPTAAAYCPACHSVFGSVRLPPAKWGPREDAHLAASEKWLAAEWRDDTEIESALCDYVKGRAVVGNAFAPLACEKGRAMLKAELKARRERDKGRAVERVGAKVVPRHLDREKAEAEAKAGDMKALVREAVKEVRDAKPEAVPAKTDAWPVAMTIKEGARFCGCTEKTIRNWLSKVNHDGSPMIANVIGTGRLTRIPRASLEAFSKRPAATKKTPRKRSARKPVKQKS